MKVRVRDVCVCVGRKENEGTHTYMTNLNDKKAVTLTHTHLLGPAPLLRGHQEQILTSAVSHWGLPHLERERAKTTQYSHLCLPSFLLSLSHSLPAFLHLASHNYEPVCWVYVNNGTCSTVCITN